jgi:hypothetical protein
MFKIGHGLLYTHNAFLILTMIFFLIPLITVVSNIDTIVLHDGSIQYSTTLYLTDDFIETPTVLIPSQGTSIVPNNNLPANTPVNVTVYGFRMTAPTTLQAVTSQSSSHAYIYLDSIQELSLLLNIYNIGMFFLGTVPTEINAHLNPPMCGDASLSLPNFVFQFDDGSHLSFQITEHIGNCSSSVYFNTHPIYNINCNTATNTTSPQTIYSAKKLGLGVYKSQQKTCLYHANTTEINYNLMILIVTICLLSIIFIEKITRFAATPTQYTLTLVNTSRKFAIIIFDLVFVIWSFILMSANSATHNIYGFAVLRMLSYTQVRILVYITAYAISTIITMSSLWMLSVAEVISSKEQIYPIEKIKFATWGISKLESKSLTKRLALFFLVIIVILSIIVSIWYVYLGDKYGTLVTSFTTIATITHLSNPHIVRNVTANHNSETKEYGRATSIYIRWSLEYPILICFQFNLPFTISGTLSPPFFLICSTAFGICLLFITARDMAAIYPTLSYKLSKCLLHLFSLFTICFVSVFSFSSLFSDNDALRNKGSLALWPSSAGSAALFSFIFAHYGTIH